MSTTHSQLQEIPQAPASQAPSYLTLSEAAGIARCSEKTLRRAIASGQLRAFRPVRKMLIAESDLRAWVEARSPGFSEPRRSRWPARSRRAVPGSVALIREMDPGL